MTYLIKILQWTVRFSFEWVSGCWPHTFSSIIYMYILWKLSWTLKVSTWWHVCDPSGHGLRVWVEPEEQTPPAGVHWRHHLCKIYLTVCKHLNFSFFSSHKITLKSFLSTSPISFVSNLRLGYCLAQVILYTHMHYLLFPLSDVQPPNLIPSCSCCFDRVCNIFWKISNIL